MGEEARGERPTTAANAARVLLPALSSSSSSSSSNSSAAHVAAVGHLFAGACSAVSAKTTVAPLERVCVVMQAEGRFRDRSTLGALRQLSQEGGFLALYRGNGANVLRTIPVYGIKFAANDWIKRALKQRRRRAEGGAHAHVRLNFGEYVVAGCLSGVVQQVATYPLEYARTILSLTDCPFRGVVRCLAETRRMHGLVGMYRGFAPTALSGVPYVGIQLTMYSWLKHHRPAGDSPTARWSWPMLSGAVASMMAQLLTFPGDTVRRRMMRESFAHGRHLSIAETAAMVVREARSYAGLYAGWRPAMMRAVPAAAVQFAVYELVLELLGLQD